MSVRTPRNLLIAPTCVLVISQLRTVSVALERLAHDRAAFVQQLAKSLPELVDKGLIAADSEQDLSEQKLRALNAAVHVVSTDSETVVLTVRSSLEHMWETMPKGAASDETREAALEKALAVASVVKPPDDLGVLSTASAMSETWLCEVAGIACAAVMNALTRKAMHSVLFSAFREAEERKAAFEAIVHANQAYSDLHDKIAAFEVRAAQERHL